MRNIFILLSALFIVIVACNKDKFTTEPQIKIKSIGPTTVVQGNLVQVKGSFTDEEGDLDSALIVYKWYNGATVTRKDTIRDYLLSSIPMPAGTRSADFTISFLYGIFGDYPTLPATPVSKDTTATLGLIFVDKANHRSNYAESEKIRLKKN
jgi:uncharacterized protein YodC (DUF2158 family)